MERKKQQQEQESKINSLPVWIYIDIDTCWRRHTISPYRMKFILLLLFYVLHADVPKILSFIPIFGNFFFLLFSLCIRSFVNLPFDLRLFFPASFHFNGRWKKKHARTNERINSFHSHQSICPKFENIKTIFQ